MRLLIVEDNVPLAWRLQAYFEKEFDVCVARNGTDGLRLAETGRYDIMLLDLSLPDMSGEEICKALRAQALTTPILILSGESALHCKVRLLEIGADDYLTKPFEPTELQARVRALLRRRQVGKPPVVLAVDNLQLDPQRRTVTRQGTKIPLRRKEFDILEYLLRNQGKVVTPTMILSHVWGDLEKDSWSNTVRVHIKHLRDKIDRPFDGALIKTARGVGYIIDA